MNLLASAVLVFLAYCLLLHLHRCTCMGSESSEAAGGSVFDHGRHAVILTRLDEARPPSRCPSARRTSPSNSNSTILPPKPLLIAAPREAGEYPVLLFLHGYLAANSFYSQLLLHIASHGFIAVAPQLYTVSGADTTAEITAAARVISWLSTAATGNLASALPLGVRADLTKLSLSGHSRGGKVAFALALGLTKPKTKLALPLAALVAVDPVDGMGVGRQTPPPVLTCGGTNTSASLHVGVPVMVIGTGLGELAGGPMGMLPPCAPVGVSHAAFYDELLADDGEAPAAKCHLVARDYGHTDMMDDETPGARGLLTRAVCRSGAGGRKPMRRFVAGATVAFLNRWVGGDGAAMDGIRDRPEQAPVELSVVEFREEEKKGMAYPLQEEEEPAAATRADSGRMVTTLKL